MKKNTLIIQIITVALFSVLFVPLIVSNSLFFPFITGKGFFFRTIVLIVCALYVWLVINDRAYLPKKSFILWAIVAFLALMGLSTFLSENPYKSFWSNFERMEGYITLLCLFAYFIVASTVFNTHKLWLWFFNSSLIVSVVVGIRGLADLSKGVDRVFGSLGNSSYLAVYALIHVFLAIFFLIRTLEQSKKHATPAFEKILWYGFLIVGNSVVLYFTGTRGALLGLFGGGMVLAIILALFERQKTYLRVLGGVGIGLAVVIIVTLGLLRGTEFAQSSPLIGRYSNLVTFDVKGVFESQGYSRTLLWPMAWEGIKERPLFGWGQESFNYVFAKYYNPNMYGQEQWFDRAHNVFLDWLIAGGVFGLLSYLSLFVVFLWYLTIAPATLLSRAEKAVLASLVVAYSIHNLFVFDHLVSYVFFFSLLAYMQYIYSTSTDRSDTGIPLIRNRNTGYVLGTVSSVLFVGLLWLVVVRPLQANTTLISAFIYQAEYAEGNVGRKGETQTLRDMLDAYKKALSYNTFGTTEIREQLVTSGQNALRADPTLANETVMLVASEMTKQVQNNLNDPRYHFFLSTFLSGIRMYPEALQEAEAAEKLSPSKQSFKFVKGEILINQKKYSEAFEVFKQAYDLAPEYEQARALYLISAVYAGKQKEINDILGQYTSVIADVRVIKAFITTGNISKGVDLLEKYSIQNPTDTNSKILLAAGYLEMGNKTKALNILSGAGTQAAQYIQAINSGTRSLFSQ